MGETADILTQTRGCKLLQKGPLLNLVKLLHQILLFCVLLFVDNLDQLMKIVV